MKTFLTLSHYNLSGSTSQWYIPGKNTGVGNMLFQIASCLSYAIENNATLYVPCINTFLRLENCKKEDTIFRNINTECPPEFFSSIMITSNNNEQNIWDYQFIPNMHFHFIYFENIINFEKNRELILRCFSPTISDILYIEQKYPFIHDVNLSSVHIRRGEDYAKICEKAYLDELEDKYFKAMDHMIEKKNVRQFLIFTNDIEYCNKILLLNPKYNNIRFHYSYERDYIDVWIMSLIKNNITSVSTLAWWGSYLNNNANRYIVCNHGNRNNLHHPDWIII